MANFLGQSNLFPAVVVRTDGEDGPRRTRTARSECRWLDGRHVKSTQRQPGAGRVRPERSTSSRFGGRFLRADRRQLRRQLSSSDVFLGVFDAVRCAPRWRIINVFAQNLDATTAFPGRPGSSHAGRFMDSCWMVRGRQRRRRDRSRRLGGELSVHRSRHRRHHRGRSKPPPPPTKTQRSRPTCSCSRACCGWPSSSWCRWSSLHDQPADAGPWRRGQPVPADLHLSNLRRHSDRRLRTTCR